ncbi:hypothetical protein HanHA300_Chr00c0023g0685851 [Helianthus annuus]|nr:hypothetical protein HanHA300_Chr00c0023g0685851 [Helianthus annuus]
MLVFLIVMKLKILVIRLTVFVDYCLSQIHVSRSKSPLSIGNEAIVVLTVCNGWRLRLVDGGCIVDLMARFIVPGW